MCIWAKDHDAALCQRLLHPPGQLGGTLLNPLPSFNPPALHNPSVLLNPSALLTTPAHAAGGSTHGALAAP